VPSCWVPVGELGGGKAVAAWECAGHWAVRAALCILLFVLYILLISIIVVTIGFVCCSVKLSLSWPVSFLPFSYHSPPHPSGGRGERVTTWPFVADQDQNCNNCRMKTF